jgi:hypothetical protein
MTTPVTADLGSATAYLENSYSRTLAAGATDQLTFTVRQSELQSTASGSIYLGIVVTDDGSALNQAPVATNGTATTHQDLATQLSVGQYISDPEGDPTFYRVVGATNGTAKLSSLGQGVVCADAGLCRPGELNIVADDGMRRRQATVTVNVSNASLCASHCQKRRRWGPGLARSCKPPEISPTRPASWCRSRIST